MFDGGLSSYHVVGNAVNLLDVLGNGYLRIYELLEGGELPAVQTKAYRSYFDQTVHDGDQPSGFGIEGQKGDLGEPWLGVIHEPSRSFPGWRDPHLANSFYRS
jgi:hypothetical protein